MGHGGGGGREMGHGEEEAGRWVMGRRRQGDGSLGGGGREMGHWE